MNTIVNRALPPQKRRVFAAFLGIAADACVIGLLALSMWLIVRAGEQPPILYLSFAIVGVRAFAVGRAALRYSERLVSLDAVLSQLAELRAETFAQLVPRVPGTLDNRSRGDVLAAFVDDLDQLQDEALRVRQPRIVSLSVVAAAVLLLAFVSLPAALLVVLVLLAAGSLSIWVAARIAGESDRELSAARAELVDALYERFAAAEVLHAFGAVQLQREQIRAAERRFAAVQRRRVRSAGFTAAVLSAGAGATTLALFAVLLPRVGEDLSAPLFAAAVIVPAAIFEVFAQFPAAMTARRVVRASAARIAHIVESEIPAEIPQEDSNERAETQAELPRGEHDRNLPQPLLAVTGFTVAHPGQRGNRSAPLTFALHSGDTLILSGPSGVGKTTLALGLVRFLDYRGSYTLDGVEANTLPFAEVRTRVGLCEQQPHIFDADLRQNLLFARDTASDDELWQVLDRVGLADWARKRDGLHTALGEQGSLVSGGQAQRIALARALLAEFRVVVLDEPTAGVDRERADALLHDLLDAVPAGRAVILITHTSVPAEITGQRIEISAARSD